MNKWLVQSNRWIPLLTIIPFVYFLGWLLSHPFRLIGDLTENTISLISTLISFLAFISLMPAWIKLRWRKPRFYNSLGIFGLGKRYFLLTFSRGIAYAVGLLLLLLISLLLSPWANWQGQLSYSNFINALFLGVGVGFAEELIFRSWLFEELDQLLGPFAAFIGQAVVFSLVHIRTNLDAFSMISLLIGLFLLGMLLALRRRSDNGSLWGSIGFHGGLVAGWFLIQAGLIELSPNCPWWLVGPDMPNPNPIGSLIAILVLTLMLFNQLKADAIVRRPFRGACNASSSGATP